MGPMSEGATTEPTVVHTSHSDRLTRGRLSRYPMIQLKSLAENSEFFE